MGEADGSVIIDTGLSTEGFDKGSKELLAAIRELSAAVTALGQKISTAFTNVTSSFGGVARGGTNAAKEVSGLEKEIDKFAGKAAELGDRTGTAFRSADDVLTFNKRIQEAEATLDELRDKFGEADAMPKISPQAAALENDLHQAEAKLDQMQSKLKSFYDQGFTDKQISFVDPDLISNIDAQMSRITELRQQVDQAQAEGVAELSAPFEQMEAQLAQAEDAIYLAKQGIDQEAIAQAQLNVQVAQEALLQAQNEQARAEALAQLEQAQAEMRGLADTMTGKIPPAANNAAKSVEKIKEKSRDAHKEANILVKAFTGLKRMLVTRLKSMFISAIFDSVKQGIKGLALFSPAFDKAISDVKNKLKEFSYNIVATFGPVVQTIMPVITRIVDGFSRAMTYVNALFAKLQGKSTMIVAKKQTASYADSLKGATEQAKALNEQVYGFDELNKRSSESSGSGSGSGSGLDDLGDMFEEVEIDSALPTRILDFINELKTAVSEGNWLHFGEVMADGVNSLSDKVRNIDFSPIVNGVNAAIDVARGFTSRIDWAGIGQNVGAFFNNAVTAIGQVNWAGVGETISNLIVGGLSLGNNFLETVDWMALGETIMQVFRDLFNNIDWESLIGQLGLLVVNLLSGAFQFLFGALSGLSGFLGDIFSALGMDGIAGFFYGIEDALKDVGTWIKEHIFDPIVNWIKKLFGIHSPSTVFEGFGSDLIAGLLAGITGAWQSILTFFTEAFANLTKFISEAWEGIKQGAITAWNNIKSSLSNTWDNVKTTATNTWNSVKTTATQKWNEIKTSLSTTWGNLKTTASNTWTNIKNTASTAWDNLKSTATTKWANIKTSLSTTWDNLKTSASTAWDNIKTKASTAWDNIKTAATTKWQDIKTTVSDKWNGLKTTLSTTNWSEIGTSLTNGLRSGISNTWSQVTSTATSLASGLTNTLKNLFGIHSPSKVWEEVIGANLTAGLSEGIELGAKDVLKTTDKLAQEVNGSMDGITLWHGASSIASKGFSVPQIAAGTVLPAKTRISSLNSTDALYGANKALLGGMDEQLDDQTYVLKQILAALKKVDLSIDMDALTRVVTKTQRAHELNYGGSM